MDQVGQRSGTSGAARVRRQIALGIEDFGRTALDDQARTLGVPVGALVSHAVRYYLALRDSERTATRIPRFTRTEEPAEVTMAVELELEESEWSALELASVEERLPIERLVEHVALLFLADVDAGRVKVRTGEEG
jgi:hypothetical protein